MRFLVYLPLLLPAVVAVGVRPLAARVEPRLATWLITLATVVLAVCSTAALALLVTAAAARVPALDALRHYSQPAVRRSDPTSAVTGVVAAVLLTGTAGAVVVALRGRARALAESYRRASLFGGDSRVVVVPGPHIEAYALPGGPGRIVVSGRLLETLDDDGRTALLAHEQAHLSGHHHLFTIAAHLAAAANPLLLPLARAVDYTVERWADEEAARQTGDRRLVAATIGHVALLATTGHQRAGALALGMVRTRARHASGARTGSLPRRMSLSWAGPVPRRVSVAWAGPVPRRVAALLTPPPRQRALLVAVCAVVVLLAGTSALEAARDLHTLLHMAHTGR
ncbi:MAG TPA: M48 family metalloprotease [Streptosporangiaceae bacterium]|nr:M48 family metalloprotease [Streptosporangiaceae bacterium]